MTRPVSQAKPSPAEQLAAKSRGRKPKPLAYPRIRMSRPSSWIASSGRLMNSPPLCSIEFAPGVRILLTLNERETGRLHGQFGVTASPMAACAGLERDFSLSTYEHDQLAALIIPIGFRKPPRVYLAEPDDAAPGHELLEAA